MQRAWGIALRAEERASLPVELAPAELVNPSLRVLARAPCISQAASSPVGRTRPLEQKSRPDSQPGGPHRLGSLGCDRTISVIGNCSQFCKRTFDFVALHRIVAPRERCADVGSPIGQNCAVQGSSLGSRELLPDGSRGYAQGASCPGVSSAPISLAARWATELLLRLALRSGSRSCPKTVRSPREACERVQ